MSNNEPKGSSFWMLIHNLCKSFMFGSEHVKPSRGPGVEMDAAVLIVNTAVECVQNGNDFAGLMMEVSTACTLFRKLPFDARRPGLRANDDHAILVVAFDSSLALSACHLSQLPGIGIGGTALSTAECG
jgi:hypothetical protein